LWQLHLRCISYASTPYYRIPKRIYNNLSSSADINVLAEIAHLKETSLGKSLTTVENLFLMKPFPNSKRYFLDFSFLAAGMISTVRWMRYQDSIRYNKCLGKQVYNNFLATKIPIFSMVGLFSIERAIRGISVACAAGR